jgi:hypothetical protein
MFSNIVDVATQSWLLTELEMKELAKILMTIRMMTKMKRHRNVKHPEKTKKDKRENQDYLFKNKNLLQK